MNLYSICLQLNLNSNHLNLNSIEFEFKSFESKLNWIWIQFTEIWLDPNCWIEFYWMELNIISTKLTHFCHHFIVISAQQDGAHVPYCIPIPEHNLTLIPETLKQARARVLSSLLNSEASFSSDCTAVTNRGSDGTTEACFCPTGKQESTQKWNFWKWL